MCSERLRIKRERSKTDRGRPVGALAGPIAASLNRVSFTISLGAARPVFRGL